MRFALLSLIEFNALLEIVMLGTVSINIAGEVTRVDEVIRIESRVSEAVLEVVSREDFVISMFVPPLELSIESK